MSSTMQQPAAGNLDLRPGRPPILWTNPGPDPVGWAAHFRNDVRQIVARHGSVHDPGPRGPRPRADGRRVRPPRGGRPAGRARALRAPHRARERAVLVHPVAGDPADVPAQRAELPARPARLHVLRLPASGRLRRRHAGRRRLGRAPGAAPAAGVATRPRGLAAGPQLQRRDRRVVGRGLRHQRPRRRRALLPQPGHRVHLERRQPEHPPAPPRRGAAPRRRTTLLVQPGRVPQRVDARPRHPRVPRRVLRTRRAARSPRASATASRSARTW